MAMSSNRIHDASQAQRHRARRLAAAGTSSGADIGPVEVPLAGAWIIAANAGSETEPPAPCRVEAAPGERVDAVPSAHLTSIQPWRTAYRLASVRDCTPSL